MAVSYCDDAQVILQGSQSGRLATSLDISIQTSIQTTVNVFCRQEGQSNYHANTVGLSMFKWQILSKQLALSVHQFLTKYNIEIV